MQTHLPCRGWRSILHYLLAAAAAAAVGCLSQCAWSGATIRRSHSRPNEVPPSKRERLLWRPQDTYQGQTGRSQEDNGLFFLATPVNVTDMPESERNPQFSHWRSAIKKVKNLKEFYSCLLTATQKAEVDSSVFGAAMQKCGYRRWWDALLDVYRIQCDMGISLSGIQRCIFLAALGNCLKDRSISHWNMNGRRVKGLVLGKQIWQGMSAPSEATDYDYNTALSSALSLCAAVGEAALPWASEILELPSHFQKNVFVYTSLLSLYEQTRHHLKVEELLKEMVSKSQPPNVVTLGELMNAAGSDLKRAEQLWNQLVDEFNVTPNVICYVAHAKVSILAGRPFRAMRILDKMWNEGLGDHNNQAALVYLQALLIACHSDPSRFSARLSSYLEGAPSMQNAGLQMKRQWSQMTNLGHSLLSSPMTVKFRDLLVSKNAKQGEMKNWKDHLATSKYLIEEQDKEATPKRKSDLKILKLNLQPEIKLSAHFKDAHFSCFPLPGFNSKRFLLFSLPSMAGGKDLWAVQVV